MFKVIGEILEPLYDDNNELVLDENDDVVFDMRYHLFNDDIEYENTTITKTGENFDVSVSDLGMSNKLLNFSVFQFSNNISLITKFNSDFHGFELNLRINAVKHQLRHRTINISLQPYLEYWKNSFSFSDFKNVFEDVFENYQKSESPVEFHFYEMRNEISLVFTYEFTFNTIRNELEKYLNVFKYLIEKTLQTLRTNIQKNSFTAIFNFPVNLQATCEQYLLYFGKFLKDLGIEASSNLREEAGEVLFSILPKDENEALDKIREALAVYLSLPSSPVSYDDSFQSMQLKQQVENLQHSQRMKEMEMRSAQYALRLAQQNIENQDKIITRQDSFIDNQNKIIEKITSSSIMIDSLENKEELEKVFDGFEVGKSKTLIENLGIHFNPATSFKTLGKVLIGKEEKISIIDSENKLEEKDN